MNRSRRAAVTAALLLLAVTAFQVALAAGAPWGAATQGGRAGTVDGALTGGYRVLAAISAALLVVGAWVVLARAGVLRSRRPGEGFMRKGAWVLVAFLALNTLGNLAGRHPFERWILGSVSLVATVLVAVVAASPHVQHDVRAPAAAAGRRG